MAYDRYGRDPRYGRGYSRPPQDYDHDDRGFLDRAGDELRSWFGDEEAERRRRWDARYDERYEGDQYNEREPARPYNPYGGGFPANYGASGTNYGYGAYGQRGGRYGPRQGITGRGYAEAREDYGGRGGGSSPRDRNDPQRSRSSSAADTSRYYSDWRERQMAAFDRDYDDYHRERQKSFEDDFGNWRRTRVNQRDSLKNAREHMEVIGSDGQHVGTVDHIRGERIQLTKSDEDAGGRHHFVPCSWIQSVDGDRVTLNRTADSARKSWQADEDDDANTSYLAWSGNSTF